MADKEKQFLSDLQSENADARFAAWRAAGEMDPSAMTEVAKLAASSNPGVAKAAREAMSTMVHAVGKSAAGPRRAAVVKQLLAVASGSHPAPVKAHAYRLLSLVAQEDSVTAIAKAVHDPELREEAVFCLERIPGNASTKALAAAYPRAKDDFKPRILAALGHRRAEEGAPLAMEAMRSADPELSTAGIKAFGRIGRKASAELRAPATDKLSEWQKIEQMDSLLRYADAQAAQGNAAEAMKHYKSALDRPEEHWQCAGIVGMAKIGTKDALAAVQPKLKSANHKVRIAAEKAMKRA